MIGSEKERELVSSLELFRIGNDLLQTMQQLKSSYAKPGRLEWIGLSSARRSAIHSVGEATVLEGLGIDGDYHAKSGKSKRQVTLIQWEHLPVIAALAGLQEASPTMLRRNLAVSGINVQMLKDQRFRIGEVILEGTGDCHPCSRMEETLGPGGYSACRGHGGVSAKVTKGGVIRIGDEVVLLPSKEKE